MALTIKQERFAREYVKCGNASAAYRTAYDAGEMSTEAVNSEAYKLKVNTEIALMISHLEDNLRRRNSVTHDRVIAELAKLAFHDIGDAFDEDSNLIPIKALPEDIRAAVSGVEFEEVFDRELLPGDGFRKSKVHVGRIHKIKLADKSKNLEMLAKHLGLFDLDNKQKRDEAPDPGRNVLTDETLAKLIAAAEAKVDPK